MKSKQQPSLNLTTVPENFGLGDVKSKINNSIYFDNDSTSTDENIDDSCVITQNNTNIIKDDNYGRR